MHVDRAHAEPLRRLGRPEPCRHDREPECFEATEDRDELLKAALTLLNEHGVLLRELREVILGQRKELLTVEEVARLTGRSDYSVRRWIKHGRIEATRVAGTGPKGRLLIPRAELEKVVAAGLGGEVIAAAVAA